MPITPSKPSKPTDKQTALVARGADLQQDVRTCVNRMRAAAARLEEAVQEYQEELIDGRDDGAHQLYEALSGLGRSLTEAIASGNRIRKLTTQMGR